MTDPSKGETKAGNSMMKALHRRPEIGLSLLLFIGLFGGWEAAVNCSAVMNAASPQQINMLRSFTATRWQIFRMVKIQTALPYIFAGLDVAVVLAVIGALVGEFIGAQAGLGSLLLHRNFSMAT